MDVKPNLLRLKTWTQISLVIVAFCVPLETFIPPAVITEQHL